ncbi:ABC transporter substrate-binding protein [Actinomyces glycerinitolerans]|uniref:Bacterial extracellular solute-binding protein n=2 Tax=Actinomyces TaxID=1654 RepID=A0A1M4RZW1_9ACTO|nr:extracellular solute-binding protein [Actinomyces glycerinitolerans]SHE25267.1 Hypothetical protein ACGLYG10_1483 [Actinomyces glycerinitolerans]
MSVRGHYTLSRRGLLKASGIVVSSAAMTSALVACGSSGPNSSDAGGAGDFAASAWAIQSSQSDSYIAAVDRWNEAHPEERIDLQVMPDNGYKDKVRVALGADQAPTLIYGWGGGGLRDYVEQGLVDSITQLAGSEHAGIAERYLEATLGAATIDGELYGVPIGNMQPVVVLYNKEVFSAIGAEVPQTWSELLNVVEQAKSANFTPIALAGQSKWTHLPYLAYLVDRIGGPEVFAKIEADQADGWSDPAVLEAARKIQELVEAGAFASDASATSYESGAADALLYTGKAAMLVMLSNAYSNIAQASPEFVESGNLGYFAFPAVEGGKGDPKDVTGNPSAYWYVTSASTDAAKDIAIRFLDEQVMNDQYVEEIIGRASVPGAVSAGDKLAAAEDPFASYVFEMVNEAPAFQLSLDQALTPVQGEALNTALDQLFLLEITPQEFVDTMTATVGK